MRSGQQSKRSRGRGNNNFNRKGANPLTRTYDSSGPDVKVRGTAQHIAEKYMSLARDAQGSGDRVVAENYLQHAEHYNRIIASAQAQLQERYQRDDRDSNSDDDDDDTAKQNNNQQQGHERNERKEKPARKPEKQDVNADGPQPVIDGTPAEVAAEEADGQPVAKSRRRSTASTRPRRTKRAAADEATGAESAGEAAAAAPAEEAAEAPKKPVRRRRTPKAAEKSEGGEQGNGKENGGEPALADASSE